MAGSEKSPLLTFSISDEVAVLAFDDGKANVVSHALLEALHEALDRAELEAKAVVLVGRPGRFSAGFDLGEMTRSVDAMRSLVGAGAEFLLRLYGLGLPTVAACTGHALAAGALLLLSSDVRIAADGPFKIGLNEVSIGMPLPIFAVELARDRLVSPLALRQATLEARIHSPAEAAEVGFVDRVVPADNVLDEALGEARRLAELRTGAYRETKANLRRESVAHIQATLDDDTARLTGPAAQNG
jgi:enoyl-CoA hydratase